MLTGLGHIPSTSPSCRPNEDQDDVTRRRETDAERAEKPMDIHYEDQ